MTQQPHYLKPRNSRVLRVERLENRLYLATVPAFSSLPGADHTIYLDFDGQTVTGTNWNSYYNQTTLNANAYDIDNNPSSFSDTELERIEEAWKRTAEDFRPFNVNVTTVDPGVEALRKSGTGDTQWGLRVVVTKESTMVTDSSERCGCGGIAYIGSFDWGSDTPVWVYTTGGKSIAEAASHEVGHGLNLSHDGLNSGTTYYRGHGSGDTGWASIMGVGYYQNVSQWDKGEYYNSNNGGSNANYNNGPDDLSVIVTGNGFGYRPDDHGDDNAGASSLSLSGTTVDDEGIIETTSDVDVFKFSTGTGTVTLDIDPFTPGPNLDVKAQLYDSEGALLETSDSSSVLDASISRELDAGTYYLHVSGTGWGSPGANPPTGYTEYASLGLYTISGTVVDDGGLPQVSISNASVTEGKLHTKGKNKGTAELTDMEFTVSLSKSSTDTVTVSYSTGGGDATAGVDYHSVTSGSLTFEPGETSKTIAIQVIGDNDTESNETFDVTLSNPTNAELGTSTGVGTIIDDDSGDGGGGKGGGRGGGNPNRSSEAEPVVVADPFWFFESGHSHSHNHDHEHFHGPDCCCGECAVLTNAGSADHEQQVVLGIAAVFREAELDETGEDLSLDLSLDQSIGELAFANANAQLTPATLPGVSQGLRSSASSDEREEEVALMEYLEAFSEIDAIADGLRST